MPVLQHYYTSFVNKENGSAGFQVKAMSLGIPSDVQSTISRLIAYRIPPTLDEHELAKHPIALRYYYEGEHRSILLCSQSNGTDENGRPGNFFAHTLVIEPGTFKQLPPILYWRSPFWRTKDPRTSSIVEPLPRFEVEPALDIEEVWSFLAQGKRIEYFHKLMSAVVHYNSSRRRIVIIDTADNVAMWIAAVSCMLPPDYRPMLSFATYHHDPYQAQFMITGTTPDSSFRGSIEEYMSFFVLNAQTDKVSDVSESPYADEAAHAAQSPEEYETRMLSLFMDYVPRFLAPICIDEQLDQMVLYARVINRQQETLTPDDLKAITKVITKFEQSNNFTREDLQELSHLGGILYNTYEAQSEHDQGIYTEYYRIVALLKEHQVPTDEAALNELSHFTQRLIREADPEQVLPRLVNLRQTYGEEMFLGTLNGAVYLQWLNQLLRQASPQQQARVWKHLGPYVRLGRQSQSILITSLCTLGELWNAKRSKEGGVLFEAVAKAVEGREQECLQLVADGYNVLPEDTLQRFYCKLVYLFDLDKRVPYRLIVQRVCDDINVYELHYEIGKAGMQDGLAALERWIEHARRQRIEPLSSLISEGLSYLRHIHTRSPQQWYELAPRILVSKALEPLPQDWEDHLVDTALSKVSLSRFSPTDIEMCKKYRKRPGLSEETRTVIYGLLAMSSGDLNQTLADRLQKRFMSLPLTEYEGEVNSFISEFLKNRVTREAHNLMVNAIFNWEHPHYFWESYWQTFTKIVASAVTAEQAVELLSFWFTSSPDMFSMQYTVEYFFLYLPQRLSEAQKVRGFHDAVRQINSLAEKQKQGWYPLVEDYFTERKNVLVSVGQSLAGGLAGQLQKRLTNQSAEEKEARVQAEQKEREEFAARVATFFEEKKIRQAHKQRLSTIYIGEKREQFWTCYWENFIRLMASQEVERTLEVLAFWFDEAFQVLEQMPYVPQSFFMGLFDALEAAKKERSFRDKARQINAKGIKQSRDYPWYRLVQECFEEQERGRFAFFRRGS